MVDLNFKYEELVLSLQREIPFTPEIALILGSGLGEFADKVNVVKSFATDSLKGYPKSTVEGHKGYIHLAEYNEKKLLVFQGRIHFYEGYPLSECIVPVHIAHNLGCTKIIITNAAGGITSNLRPADLMLITSFNSIFLKKELSELLGVYSLDQKNSSLNCPSEGINNAIRQAFLEEKIILREGVYWYGKGPSYETPAEIQMQRIFNADAVGMSTVHEAIYASSLGMKVGAISCITNYAAGISPDKLSHQEVMETAEIVKPKFERLVKRIITLL